jgi:hypothetical protein
MASGVEQVAGAPIVLIAVLDQEHADWNAAERRDRIGHHGDWPSRLAQRARNARRAHATAGPLTESDIGNRDIMLP